MSDHAQSSSAAGVTHAVLPSRKWYLVAAVLFSIGVIVFGVTLWAAIGEVHQKVNDLKRVAVPGQVSVPLEKPGTYTVYYEKRSVMNGQPYTAPDPLPEIALKVTGPDGESVEVSRKKSADMYDLDRYAGTGTWQFEVTKAGPYQLQVPPAESAPDAKLVLAVGQLGLKQRFDQVWGLFGAAGLLAILIVASAVMALLTFTARIRAKAYAAEGGDW
jgi:hypothetical protein